MDSLHIYNQIFLRSWILNVVGCPLGARRVLVGCPSGCVPTHTDTHVCVCRNENSFSQVEHWKPSWQSQVVAIKKTKWRYRLWLGYYDTMVTLVRVDRLVYQLTRLLSCPSTYLLANLLMKTRQREKGASLSFSLSLSMSRRALHARVGTDRKR